MYINKRLVIIPQYYMAISHKDQEPLNSRIWLAEISIESVQIFPFSRLVMFCSEKVAN